MGTLQFPEWLFTLPTKNMKSVLASDNIYLDVVKYFLVLVGMWRAEDVRYLRVRRIYVVYSYVPLGLLVTFLFLQLASIPIHLRNGELELVVSVVGLSVSYVVELIKLAMFASAGIKAAYRTIVNVCRSMRDCPDPVVKEIFTANAAHAVNINRYYCLATMTVLCLLDYGAWYQYSVIYPRELVNVTGKPLPLVAWLPFDPDLHYGLALVVEVMGVHMGGHFYMAMQCMLLGLIVYVSGQLQVLRHLFANFQHYVVMFADRHGLSRRLATRHVFKILVQKHQEIIRFHDELNDALTYILLTELLLNSILIASLVFQIANLVIDFATPFTLTYSLLMLSHIFILYWNTNEIIIHSLSIADAVMENKWNDEDIWIQRCSVLVLIRAQRPLAITCGPFATASTTSIITILKASYSYAMLMLR